MADKRADLTVKAHVLKRCNGDFFAYFEGAALGRSVKSPVGEGKTVGSGCFEKFADSGRIGVDFPALPGVILTPGENAQFCLHGDALAVRIV